MELVLIKIGLPDYDMVIFYKFCHVLIFILGWSCN